MEKFKPSKYNNMWLVFNFGFFRDWFRTKKDAVTYIKENNAEEYYQLYKGEIKFDIEKEVKFK